MRGNASQAMRPHPWRLVGALRVCAVLHKRQDRGWASCPTRPAHAPNPWRPTVPRTLTPPPQIVSRWPRQGQSVKEQSSTPALEDTASPLRTDTLSKAGYGWVGGTVGRHGWRSRAYRDVLAACPANPPVPGQARARTNSRQLILILILIRLRLSAFKKQTPKKNAPTEVGACPLERDVGSVLRGQGDPGEGRIALHPHVPGTGRR